MFSTTHQLLGSVMLEQCLEYTLDGSFLEQMESCGTTDINYFSFTLGFLIQNVITSLIFHCIQKRLQSCLHDINKQHN